MRSHSAPTLDELAAIAARVLQEYAETARKRQRPVVRWQPQQQISDDLHLPDWLARGGMDSGAFENFLRDYLDRSTSLHHPRFMAHQVAVPHPASAIADLINGYTNNGMAIYEMGPPAVALERLMVGWMLSKVGWQGDGILTHGGSAANLTALLAARAHSCPQVWKEGIQQPLAVLSPASSHYSIGRALSIMGPGSDALYPIPVDDFGVVLPDKLPEVYQRAVEEGRRVIAVTANACATSTGLYDPLGAIGRFCRQQELWFHVDAAHGASALLSERYSALLDGIEMADSVVWDAHKMLRTSALCAAVLFREASHCKIAFHQNPVYLSHNVDEAYIDLYPYALECTKAPLGLKLFLILALEGEEKLRNDLERLYDQTRIFHQIIGARAGLESPFAPEANIVCFRTERGAPAEIRTRLLHEGEFHISSTTLPCGDYLRLVVMNPETEESDVRALLDRIDELTKSPPRTNIEA